MTADLMPQRVLPLAGLLQALREVRHLAENGHVEQTHLATAIDSVFRLDAESVAAVYGGVPAVADGLRLLLGFLNNSLADKHLGKLGISVLQLERSFSQNRESSEQVRQALLALTPRMHNTGSTHPDILRELGSLYSRAISPLSPRIMVQGSPHYLGRSDVINDIRALLLAALRSAMLWRQMGGSQWDLLLQRGAMRRAAEALLAGA